MIDHDDALARDLKLARDLNRLVESEELGEAYFATASRWARSPSARHRWDCLHELEVQTNQAVREYIQHRLPALNSVNRIAGAAGTMGATTASALPDHVHVRLIRQGTRRYLPAFERLAAHYRGTADQVLFDYVVAHEHAIIDFAGRTLDNRDDALVPVLSLLDNPAARLPS